LRKGEVILLPSNSLPPRERGLFLNPSLDGGVRVKSEEKSLSISLCEREKLFSITLTLSLQGREDLKLEE
jgi:hypothetical protein